MRIIQSGTSTEEVFVSGQGHTNQHEPISHRRVGVGSRFAKGRCGALPTRAGVADLAAGINLCADQHYEHILNDFSSIFPRLTSLPTLLQ